MVGDERDLGVSSIRPAPLAQLQASSDEAPILDGQQHRRHPLSQYFKSHMKPSASRVELETCTNIKYFRPSFYYILLVLA